MAIQFTDDGKIDVRLIQDGTITPEDIHNYRNAHPEELPLKFLEIYEVFQVQGVGVRCKFCGTYVEWDKMHSDGLGNSGKRNNCPECHEGVYHCHYAVDKPMSGEKNREYQIELGNLIYGTDAEYRSYQWVLPIGVLIYVYVGHTDNIIARNLQHRMRSSNPNSIVNTIDSYNQLINEDEMELFRISLGIQLGLPLAWGHVSREAAIEDEHRLFLKWKAEGENNPRIRLINKNSPICEKQ